MIQIANLLMRSLFRFEKVTTASVQGNNTLLQGVIATKDTSSPNTILVTQREDNNLRNE